jgi:transposase
MKRFIEGEDRKQVTLLPECLEDYVGADNPVRVVDVFVDQLELRRLGFAGVEPAETGRPSYHPAVLLKIYIYGYLNRVQSSRRLEREAQRNVELMCAIGSKVSSKTTHQRDLPSITYEGERLLSLRPQSHTERQW